MAVGIINGFNAISPSLVETGKLQKTEGGTIPFADFLKDALDKTNNLLIESDQLTEDFAAGRTDNIHQVLIAAEKADVALQFTLQVRNKIMDAYNEIMRMQI